MNNEPPREENLTRISLNHKTNQYNWTERSCYEWVWDYQHNQETHLTEKPQSI